MFNDIDLDNPDFVVPCRLLKKSVQIYDIMRDQGITKMYAYGILYNPKTLVTDFLKIGQSCPEPGEETDKAVGERLKRQLAWMDGWNESKPKSEHGMGFRLNLDDEINKGNLPNRLLNKNALTFCVWNLDKRTPTTFTTKDRYITEWVEGELARQYKAKHQFLPILNYKDPTQNKAYGNCNISITHFNSLFTFE